MRTFVPGVRTLVLICIISLYSTVASSQSITSGNGKLEIGLGLGPMFFVGDVGGTYGIGKGFIKDVNLPLTKLSKGIFLTIAPEEWIGFRLAINQSMIDGYDNILNPNSKGEDQFRRQRNLEFRSNIWEVYGALEFFPTVFFEQYDGLKGKFRPYGVVGVGAFHFNPQGRYYPGNSTAGASQWVNLQPLRLEGQGMAEYPDRKQYSLTQIHIPMGVGFKYYISDKTFIGLEVLHRKTFTDYMDNVSKDYIDANLFDKYLSPQQAIMAKQLYYRENLLGNAGSRVRPAPAVGEQRGDPKRNDAFFSTILRLGWRLNDWNSPNGRAARQMRCPAFY
ncbi:MAG: hypothetical protein NVS9B7_04030 [Flavisolibacter sp.]